MAVPALTCFALECCHSTKRICTEQRDTRAGRHAPGGARRPARTHGHRHGRVIPRRGIERFDGKTVVFVDNRKEDFDTVIWATGYSTVFPFFDRSFVDWREARRLPLYLKIMMADVPNLYFIGLFQPIGCIWTLADYQAQIAAAQIAGRLARPANIAARIEREMTRIGGSRTIPATRARWTITTFAAA